MLRFLRSKLSSLRSISEVYYNWLGIMRVYLLGGETNASLHDSQGNKLRINVSKHNIKRIISLGRILAESQIRYEVRDNEIRCSSCPPIITTLSPDLSPKELDSLRFGCLLSRYTTDFARFDDNHYLATDIDGIKWILRRASPITLRYDSLFGPLLSYHQEPREYGWFSSVLRKGDIFIDVGANVGGYSVRASRMGSKVIAVEPDPDNYRVLKLNLELNQCIDAHVLNIAAGRKEEVCDLYVGGSCAPAGYSLLQPKRGGEVRCSVNVKPLDVAIPPLLNNEPVDLLKIDVEGVEVDVIKGAFGLLKQTRYIIIEVIPGTKPKISEVLDLLKPLGFRLIDKVCRKIKRTANMQYCDLFLGKSYRTFSNYRVTY
jgi:FkbM family methyltransferase